MPLVIPVNHYEVAYHHRPTGSLREAVCTLGVEYTGADLLGDLVDLQNAWANRISPVMADNWAYVRFTAREAAGTVWDNNFVVQGGSAGTPTTPQVTFIVRKSNVAPGRKNRGRFYLPGVREADADGVGNVTAGRLGELDAALGLYKVDIQGANFNPVILHNGPAAPTPVLNFVTEAMVGTQRRRLRK